LLKFKLDNDNFEAGCFRRETSWSGSTVGCTAARNVAANQNETFQSVQIQLWQGALACGNRLLISSFRRRELFRLLICMRWACGAWQ